MDDEGKRVSTRGKSGASSRSRGGREVSSSAVAAGVGSGRAAPDLNDSNPELLDTSDGPSFDFTTSVHACLSDLSVSVGVGSCCLRLRCCQRITALLPPLHSDFTRAYRAADTASFDLSGDTTATSLDTTAASMDTTTSAAEGSDYSYYSYTGSGESGSLSGSMSAS